MSKSEGLILKYFVLKPKGNDIYAVASRKAMQTYAKIIESVNPEFANDLYSWIGREHIDAEEEKEVN